MYMKKLDKANTIPPYAPATVIYSRPPFCVEVSVLRARSVEVSALGYGARLYVVRPDEALLHLRRGAIEEVKRLSYSLYWGQLSADPHLGGVEYLVLALIGLATSGGWQVRG